MAHPILMPKAGQSMTEGKIVTWLKKEGDAIERGTPLLEIETDKANLDVEATEEGILRLIAHQEGETVPVLTVIGVIGEQDEDIDIETLRSKHETPVEEDPSPGTGEMLVCRRQFSIVFARDLPGEMLEGLRLGLCSGSSPQA